MQDSSCWPNSQDLAFSRSSCSKLLYLNLQRGVLFMRADEAVVATVSNGSENSYAPCFGDYILVLCLQLKVCQIVNAFESFQYGGCNTLSLLARIIRGIEES